MDTETKRERKATTFFVAPDAATKKEVKVSDGSGLLLSENEYFCHELEKFKSDDEIVKALHSLMFNLPGRKGDSKKNLRKFSGFEAGTNKDEKVSKVLEKKKIWTVTNLKAALGMFGLERSGDRETLVDRLVTYLMKPTSTKNVTSSSTSKKRKSAGDKKASTKGKKTKKDKSVPPRPPSSYIMYSQSIQNQIKTENPDATFGERGKIVANMWKSLSDGDKELWKIKASDAKIAYDLEHKQQGGDGQQQKKKSKSSSNKKAKTSTDSGDDGEGDGENAGEGDEEDDLFGDSDEESLVMAGDDGSEHEQYEQEE